MGSLYHRFTFTRPELNTQKHRQSVESKIVQNSAEKIQSLQMTNRPRLQVSNKQVSYCWIMLTISPLG